MADTNQQTKIESKKSKGRQDGGLYSSINTDVSSDNKSCDKALILTEYDEALEIKEEIIQDQERHQNDEQNPLFEMNQLDENSITSDHKSSAQAFVKYEFAETLDIKEGITQDQESHQNEDQNPLFEINQLDENSIISDNKSSTETVLKFEFAETLDIKEEIIQDQERHQLNEKSITSDNNSSVKTLIECEIDRTLETKEEKMPDPEADTREANALSTNKLQNQERQKIQDSRQKSEKIYKCGTCARIYKHKYTLNNHKKYECGIMPQFSCDFCGKQFKRKFLMDSHKNRVHQISNKKNQKIQGSKRDPEKKYKCGKCARSYKWSHDLNRHKKFECGVMPQFSCEFCGKRFKRKSYMSTHIVRVHQETISNQKKPIRESKQGLEKKYECEKCARRYKWIADLNRHKEFDCDVTPQFRCELCAKQFKRKSHLKSHIGYMHQKTNSNTSQTRHKCEECSRSYTVLSCLNRHKRTYHAAVKPQFACDYCDYITNVKSSLSRHIASHHLK